MPVNGLLYDTSRKRAYFPMNSYDLIDLPDNCPCFQVSPNCVVCCELPLVRHPAESCLFVEGKRCVEQQAVNGHDNGRIPLRGNAREESVRLLRRCAARGYDDAANANVGQIANLPRFWQVGNLPHVP
jgi:hypothetical protein